VTYDTIKAYLKAHPLVARLVVVVCVFGAGAGVGRFVHPRLVTVEKTHETVVLTTEYKAQRVEVVGETIYKDRTITKYVFTPTGQVSGETVEHDQTSDQKDTTTTAVAEGTTNQTTDVTSEKVTKPADIPRFYADVGAGLQPLRPAGVVMLLDFGVRPFQVFPITAGAWLTLPTTDLKGTALGLKIGVQW
jgi:hypothetical protein